ncbi:MAG TPA: hypothetical protein VHL09_13080 [Dehalococcoidia bacterium]|nr:hypothetical protein [Dehalococcoidia bacterium]
MPDPAIVGVRVGPSGPVHFYATEDPDLAIGELVSVPAGSGPAVARVVIAPHQVLNAELSCSPRMM